MRPTYTLKILTDFAAAHVLRNYPGECSQLHGHNWKVEVEVKAHSLDECDMAMDFKLIRKAAKQVADELDHCYLNELPAFSEINPTAEAIAAYFYKRLQGMLDNERAKVFAITIWETERACARYTEEETS